MSDSDEQLVENFNVKEKETELFGYLDHVLRVSQEKFNKEKAQNSDRQKWARIIIGAVNVYGDLLESSRLDELEARVKLLEEQNVGKTE